MPTVVSWPKHLPAGITINEPTSSMDLWPTVAKLAGVDIPNDRIIDGQDLVPFLTNQTHVTSHEFIFHYCANQVHAVRYRPKDDNRVWKAHFMSAKWSTGTEGCFGMALCLCHGKHVNVHDPPLLYDITNDPAESQTITTDHPDYDVITREIYSALRKHKDGVSNVPSQLGKNFFYPWLQMCCNYPLCICQELDRDLQHYPSHN